MPKTKKLVLLSILTALSAVLTMFPQFPIPAGAGYVHFGDSIIYITALLLDPVSAMLVGGIGHALADYLSGYSIFVIPTLIIKSLVGFTVSYIAHGGKGKIRLFSSFALALFIIVAGYFCAEIVLFGFAKAAVSLVSSTVQWLMSIAATAALLPIFKRVFKISQL